MIVHEWVGLRLVQMQIQSIVAIKWENVRNVQLLWILESFYCQDGKKEKDQKKR